MQNDFCKTGAALILLSDLHTCLLGDEVLSADRRPKTGEALSFQGSEARSISNSAKVKSADYIASSLNAKSWPAATLPEIAVIGRSNVGKSSLINMLTGRKDLALVSKSPGHHCHIASCLPEGCSLTCPYIPLCAPTLQTAMTTLFYPAGIVPTHHVPCMSLLCARVTYRFSCREDQDHQPLLDQQGVVSGGLARLWVSLHPIASPDLKLDAWMKLNVYSSSSSSRQSHVRCYPFLLHQSPLHWPGCCRYAKTSKESRFTWGKYTQQFFLER